MPFDAAVYPASIATPRVALLPSSPAAPALCPEWTRRRPDRALAALFVQPVDGEAIDVLTGLDA